MTGAPGATCRNATAPGGPGLRPVSPLAARWHLGQDRHPAPSRGRREGPDHLGGERRLHRLPDPPVRRRGGEKGDLQKEPPGGIGVEPADHAPGRSRGGLTTQIHLAVDQGQKPLSVVITAGQRRDSPQFEPVLEAIRVPRLGRGRPRTRPDRVRADKAYDSHSNEPTCEDAGSGRPSRSPRTGSATIRNSAPEAVGHRRSTRPTTSSGTRSNAASTGSSATGP
ncbi:transposase [Streptomyces sp. NPDC007861]|uniref:transposase n=1 Tax=Streptomyces sp. NPDC007861 TaxID=3154893 RepID=UPI0033E46725